MCLQVLFTIAILQILTVFVLEDADLGLLRLGEDTLLIGLDLFSVKHRARQLFNQDTLEPKCMVSKKNGKR